MRFGVSRVHSAREYNRFSSAKRNRVPVWLGERGGRARIEGDSRCCGNRFVRHGRRARKDTAGRLRDRGIAQGVRERTEGDAFVGAVTERGRLAAALLGESNFVLRVCQAVQHRGVLREQQHGGKQQTAEKLAHADQVSMN